MELAWRGGYGRGHGGWIGPWPGGGPFSHLPPWYRFGWWFGRGRGLCRWLLNPYVQGAYGYQAYSPYMGSGAYPPFATRYWRRPYSYLQHPAW
ncbi:MAG: hypothetical protein QW158_02985 [Nitrososphaerales archaeon]